MNLNMRRYSCHAAFVLALLLVLAHLHTARGADAAVQQAVADLQHQDYKSAEQKLRAELKLHPSDSETLSLLGISLDEQKRFPEAAEFHKRAMAISPRSTAVLYNYANNLLATGDRKTARDVLLKSLAIDPSDHNTNLALTHLLADLDLAGKRTEADALFQKLSAVTENNGKLSAEDGMALAKAGQFAQAETFLSHALAADPANFQLLYTLGVAASQAGHNERARGVLETALRQQPKNLDALYALALVYNALAQPEQAIRLLAEAAQLDPRRADVQKLTAITAKNMKADEDSAAAWDRYLKLVPNDDEARRERAFEKARITLLDEALPDLRAYVARHPDDAMGFYELGLSESVDDPAKGTSTLDRAIALKPDFVAARAARGILLYSQNKPEAAVKDLEFAVSQLPPNAPERAVMLDHLGQAYIALNRLADAVPALRKAAQLAPDDPTTQLHLANALAEAGQTQESDALMERFRQMSPGGRTKKVQGVVDYLSMMPDARHELYRARLEKTIQDHPDDINSQLLYLKYLLSTNEMAAASEVALKLPALKPGAVALADAGHALLAARQFPAAKNLLSQPGVADSSPSATLDLAIATFHAPASGIASASDGLRQLDRIAEASRGGDYYLAKAQMLEASSDSANAIAAIEQALKLEPERVDSYWQAAVLMSANHRDADLFRLLDQAAKTLPGEPQIPVIQAAFLELSGKTDDALRTLAAAQHRWPEVASIWVAQGIILAAHDHVDASRKALETAAALGAHSPETYSALAEKLFLTAPPDNW
jgi:tetratricopeptide (TPR) repeat protein